MLKERAEGAPQESQAQTEENIWPSYGSLLMDFDIWPW